MKAKYTEDTVFTMDYGDLDELASHHLGFNFEFVPSEECGNDSQHRYSVVKDYGGMEKYDKKDIAKMKAGGSKMYGARLVLCELCRMDVIPEGDWIIDVYW